jgi:hypothetical protein
MSKDRICHEDVCIDKTYHFINGVDVPDSIPDKYPFYYKARWISNHIHTKRIAKRTIKAFTMTFLFELIIGYADNILVPLNMINIYITFS